MTKNNKYIWDKYISGKDNDYSKKVLHFNNSPVFFQDKWLLLWLL